MSRRLVLDDGRSQRELVVKERMTVGRDPGCDISDGDPRLSRRHAEFLATPSGLMVRDLESRIIAYAKEQKPSEWMKAQPDYLGAQGKTLFDPDFDIDDAGMPHLKPVLPKQ